MSLLNEIVLPADVAIVPFDQVKHREIAAKIDIDANRRYFAVTRLLLRTPTRIVDETVAALLETPAQR